MRSGLRARSTYTANRRAYAALAAGSGADSEFPWGQDYPCFHDRSAAGGVAYGQYFHQDLLVAQWIFAAQPQRHIDVGSRVDGFAAHVATFREIELLDIRPITTSARGLVFHVHDILAHDPSWDAATDSLSCLHTIEHFGLGRYGDPLDPDGWRLGWANMVRMVKPGGTIYLSTMIGPQHLQFDAHRVFSIPTLLELVAPTCDVLELAYVDEAGELHVGADWQAPGVVDSFGCRDGCAILRLRRR